MRPRRNVEPPVRPASQNRINDQIRAPRVRLVDDDGSQVGIKTTADLGKQQPAALMASVTTANQAKKITEKPPTEPQLADWIGQAQKLPQVLEEK